MSGLLDAECVWSKLSCGPFYEAAAAPSCDAVRLTVRLASFCPNNAGLVPTEAPWKKKVQVKVVQLIPNKVQSAFFSFKATSRPLKSDKRDHCQRADLTTGQIESSLFADMLNTWICGVFFFLLPFVTRYTHVMQPAAAPCMTGAVNFKKFKKKLNMSIHVSILHASSNLFESAGMSLPP